MTDRAIDIFDHPRKTCFDCQQWVRHYATGTNGYLEALCRLDEGKLKTEYRRASDYCSHFKRLSV